MSKEKKNTQNEKRKLSRQERKQIDTLIRQAKGDGKPHTAQDSIPFERMYKDGICRLANGRYSKCIEFEDINYQLAQPDDKTAIFEALCDMYNSFDASISVQLSLISRHANKDDFKNSITIAPQNDDFDSIRAEYTEMLRTQLERGNNGLIKTKFLTFTVEAKDIRSARARLARIETDTLNHFKVIGAAARVLDGKQRLEVLHGIFHPDGERFNFAWEWLPASGLSVKDFIAPSSFRFGDGRMFQMGGKFGVVSFLQIVAPELSDRMLADFMDAENGIIVNLHIQSIDHNEAIKTIKRKIAEGQTFDNPAAEISERYTQPPKAFTEDTLLSAMESAGKEDTPEDAERKGLGTTATRAGIIEKLISAGFAERKGKKLIPTKDGYNLVAILPDSLTSPQLTAEWETRLTGIAKGSDSPADFMRGIEEMTAGLVKTYSAISEDKAKLFTPQREAIGTCPRCGAAVYEGKKNFYCSDSGWTYH